MTNFSDQFNVKTIESKQQSLSQISSNDIQNILNKDTFTLADFPYLIAPAATQHLELLAQKSQRMTRQRFGYTMGLFAPLYLSNHCYNNCSYCGFSRDLDIKRKTLSTKELHQEASILKEKGFDNILL